MSVRNVMRKPANCIIYETFRASVWCMSLTWGQSKLEGIKLASVILHNDKGTCYKRSSAHLVTVRVVARHIILNPNYF
jgi:hypothetical protein